MNMNGIKELFDTGKGVLAIVIITVASVLYGLGKMTIDQWKDTATWVFGMYAGASALRVGMQAIGDRKLVIRSVRGSEPPPVAETKIGIAPGSSPAGSGLPPT